MGEALDPVPYMCYGAQPSRKLADPAKRAPSWATLTQTRGWCRLRARVMPLVHIGGTPTQGRGGRCIFCSHPAPRPYHHVFGECPSWSSERDAVRAGGGLQGALGSLGAIVDILNPSTAWEEQAFLMAGQIEARARKFWQEHGNLAAYYQSGVL